jgi:hypothetical protein
LTHPSAICERQELPVHRMRTRFMVPPYQTSIVDNAR